MGLHRQYFLVVLSSALFLGGPVCGSQQRHSGGSGGEGEGEGEGGDEGEGEGSGEGEGEGSTGSGRQGDPCATSADCRQFYWCIAGRCALTTDLWAD